MNPPHEIRPLTALRAIAALLVFLSHYSGLHYERAAYPWQSILIEGHAGVTIFFVLSGFLITLRYLPDIQARRFSSYDYFLKDHFRVEKCSLRVFQHFSLRYRYRLGHF